MNAIPENLALATREKIDRVLEAHSYDPTQIVGILLQFGIWMCPIMYDEKLFFSKAPWVSLVLKLNPFYYIVAGYRDSMITGSPFWMRPKLGIYFWGLTIVIFFAGLRFFGKLRPHFSDVL